MSDIVKLPGIETKFGVCPECGLNDGYLNIVKQHWYYCERHKYKWCAGEDLFSSWQEDTEQDWQKNKHRLARYKKVKPVYPEFIYS